MPSVSDITHVYIKNAHKINIIERSLVEIMLRRNEKSNI